MVNVFIYQGQLAGCFLSDVPQREQRNAEVVKSKEVKPSGESFRISVFDSLGAALEYFQRNPSLVSPNIQIREDGMMGIPICVKEAPVEAQKTSYLLVLDLSGTMGTGALGGNGLPKSIAELRGAVEKIQSEILAAAARGEDIDLHVGFVGLDVNGFGERLDAAKETVAQLGFGVASHSQRTGTAVFDASEIHMGSGMWVPRRFGLPLTW
jgi:hypothetical protein